MWVRVVLDPEEMDLAVEMGNRRQDHAEKMGYKPFGGFAGPQLHVTGYLGELAMSKYLGVPMPSEWTWAADKARGHDVAGWHVRSSSKPDGRLLLKPRDPEGNYVLVLTHDRPVCYVVGWITRDRGRKFGFKEYLGDQPVKYVAQHLLISFPDIRGSFCLRGDGYERAA